MLRCKAKYLYHIYISTRIATVFEQERVKIWPLVVPSILAVPNSQSFPIFNPISSIPKFIRIKIHENSAIANKHTLGIHPRSRSIFLLASLFTARFGSAPVPKPSLNPSPIIEPSPSHPNRWNAIHSRAYVSSHIGPLRPRVLVVRLSRLVPFRFREREEWKRAKWRKESKNERR